MHLRLRVSDANTTKVSDVSSCRLSALAPPRPRHDIDFFLWPPLPSESPPSPFLAGAAARHDGGVRKAN